MELELDPLDAIQITSAEEADLVVSHLLTTFKGIWVGAWGPRVENVMRFSLKALIEANRTIIHADPHQGSVQQYTLLDLVVLLTRQNFRHRLLDQVQDAHVLDWWHQFYERLDVKLQNEITTPAHLHWFEQVTILVVIRKIMEAKHQRTDGQLRRRSTTRSSSGN